MEKDLLNDSTKQFKDNDYSQLAEMVLKKSLLKYRLEMLRQEIDKALINRDKDEFLRLTTELNTITDIA